MRFWIYFEGKFIRFVNGFFMKSGNKRIEVCSFEWWKD